MSIKFIFLYFFLLFNFILFILNIMYKLIILENNISGDYMIRDIMTYKIISGQIDDSFKDISLLMK